MKTIFICAAAILLGTIFPVLAWPIGYALLILALIGFVKAAND